MTRNHHIYRFAVLFIAFAFVCAPGAALAKSEAGLMRVEAGFSHGGGNALDVVLRGIHAAKKSIRMAVFSFTSKDIASALVDAHKRGVDIQVVADEKANTQNYTAATYLANNRVPVRLNGRYPTMHNKFLVIDGMHVQTGSFNYTKAAARKNAENVLLLWNVPDIAALYLKEWQHLWEQGREFAPKH